MSRMAIGQVLVPLQLAAGAIVEYANLPTGTFAKRMAAFTGDVTIRSALFALLVYTAFLFFSRRAAFPRMFVVTVIATLVVPFVLGGWVTLTSGVNTMANMARSEFYLPYLGAIIISAIWISYLQKSQRVKNTFVR